MSDIPAFPVSFKWGDELSQYNGMTLRDYFASKAMQALIENDSLFSEIPTQAYELADAMMKARKE